MEEREERGGRAEVVFRRANVTLEETYRSLVPAGLTDAGLAPFICECSDARCTRVVQLSLDEFAAVREHPRRFAVAPGHTVDDVVRVVETTDRFAVVERDGVSAREKATQTY